MSTMHASEQTTRAPLRIGDWLVDPNQLRIHGQSGAHNLEPRVMELLLYLAERPGQVISAEQLLIDIWHGTFYGDGPVQRAMALLRRSLGDQAQTPRYIETIRKRGYRLIAQVVLPEDYQASRLQPEAQWTAGSPFVGLRPFAAEHSSVYFGRSRATAAVLEAMRDQRSNGSGLVLLLGASGSGKTSLLQAGVLPLVCREQGFDQLRVVTWSAADFAGMPTSPIAHLATALCTWQLSGRPVFLHRDSVIHSLRTDPAALLADLDTAFERWPTTRRHPDGLALLWLDHCEALLNAAHPDAAALNGALAVLAAHPRVLVLVVCRSDFYPELLAQLPVVAERKLPDGHVDLLPPTAGELAEVIRRPAQAAGLRFEKDPSSAIGLDDALRDAAIAHPEALPLLQYTLQALFEQRSGHWLSYTVYRSIGGLEGALAQHAESVYAGLPAPIQEAFTPLLQRLVVSHEGQRALTARKVPRSALESPAEVELVDQLVAARLFTSSLIDDQAHIAVTHESLLRAWPRIRNWALENERQLRTQQRIEQATMRWLQAGRRPDLLLTRGMPLAEARELLEQAPRLLDPDQQALIRASMAADRKRRRRLWYALAFATLLALTSIVLAIREISARADADRQRAQAEQLIDFLLIDLADSLRPIGRLALMDKVAQRALDHLGQMPEREGNETAQLQRSRALRTLGEVLFGRGDQAAAEQAWLQAEQGLAKLPAARADVSLERGTVAYWMGNQAFQRNQLDTAKRHFERYHTLMAALLAQEPGNLVWQLELSYALNNLGSVAQKQGQAAAALKLFEESAAIKEQIVKAQPENTSLAVELADSWSWIGSLLEVQGRLIDARQVYERMLALLREVCLREPGADGWRHRLALAELIVGNLDQAIGKADDAGTLLLSAESTLNNLLNVEPSNDRWKRDLSYAQYQLASWYLRLGNAQKASSLLESASIRLRGTLDNADAPVERRRLLAMIELRSAHAAKQRRDDEQAHRLLGMALTSVRNLHAAAPLDAATRDVYARIVISQGDWNASKDQELAHSLWSQAIEILEPIVGNTLDRRVLEPWIATHSRLNRLDSVEPLIRQLRAGGLRHEPEAPLD